MTVRVFGFYLIVVGLAISVAPNIFLNLFGIPSTTEVWVRGIGLFSAVVGWYYVEAAKNNLTKFYETTITGRVAFATGLIIFVLTNIGPPQLLIFAAIDLLGAWWTKAAMKNK